MFTSVGVYFGDINGLKPREQRATVLLWFFLFFFITELQGGMLMTKPNYRALITATFTKLITAERRQALQVIHYVGH